MTTFWIQPGYTGREALKVMDHAPKMGHEVKWGKNPPKDIVPIGDVEFCESFLDYRPIPDFAPTWLCDYWHRDIKVIKKDNVKQNKELFVKSAEKYKAWPAKIFKEDEELPEGILLISDVVKFEQEWRYYVANGKVLATGWYDGWGIALDEDEPAPNLNIKWPEHFCGAVDFGRLSTGEIALVESQHPYACGWYGDDHKAYVNWLIEGWNYMVLR